MLVCSSSLVVAAETSYLQAERLKNLGVAYLENDRPVEAERAFRRVTQLVSNEALGYANLGVAELRLGQLDTAASQLEQARRLAPKNPEVLLLVAEVQYSAGRWESVIATGRQVLAVDPQSVMARYYIYRAALAQRQTPETEQLATRELEQLYREAPHNLVVSLQYARRQAARHDATGLRKTLSLIHPAILDAEKALPIWSGIDEAIAQGDIASVPNSLRKLENVLRPTARFRHDLARLQPPVAGLPLQCFSTQFYTHLEPQRPHAVQVQFQPMPQDQLPRNTDLVEHAKEASLDFVDIDGDGVDEWLVGYADGLRGSMQLWQRVGGSWSNAFQNLTLPPARQVRLVDFDSDGHFEALGIGPSGLVMLVCDEVGKWSETKPLGHDGTLPGNALEILDADNEGDLDLCVAGESACALWQNRGDGTFANISQQSGLAAAGADERQVVATDHDDDLDTDLILVGADGLPRLYDNRRLGHFVRQDCQLTKVSCRFVLTRDYDNDGYEDLVCMSRAGQLAIQYNRAGQYAPPVAVPIGSLTADALADFDFDNDGWLDLAVAGRCDGQATLVVLRNNGDGTWSETQLTCVPEFCVALGTLDIDRDGDMDLIGIDQTGSIHGWRNVGGNTNHWLRVTLKGLRIAGAKNNLEGMGSKLEIKAGLLYGMRFVRRPATHFGLGTHSQADLLRVVWSNGIPQNQIHPVADQTVREVQVLKGSCPYLYCWNGTEYDFVTDTLAGAPLGLQVAAGVVAPDNPRELLTIPRERIAPRHGRYEFQYTSELWETVYLDEVALWVIDHPQDSEVFTDQRFLPPPYGIPEPIFTRGRIAPVRAEDSRGRDVTAKVLHMDHQYPESLAATRYQGIVRPHCLTLQFGDVTRLAHPMLILGCWIFWTDTSINVAWSQDPTHQSHPTRIETWHPDTGSRRPGSAIRVARRKRQVGRARCGRRAVCQGCADPPAQRIADLLGSGISRGTRRRNASA